MRFGLVHRIMSDTLAFFGVLALISTSQINKITSALILGGLLLAMLVPDEWQKKPAIRFLAATGPVALFLIEAGRLAFGGSPIDVAVEFAAFLQVFRLATRQGAAHDQQVIMLALLHFIAGTVLGGGVAFGVCLLGFLVAAPGALVLSHLRREVEGNYRQGARDRTGLPVDVPRILRSRRVVGRGFLLATCLLSVPILVFMTVIFVFFPRVGLSLMLMSHPRGRMVGFSDHVDLGQVGTLHADPTVALRFTPENLPAEPPLRMPLRLRGTAFDAYSEHSWHRTESEKRSGSGTFGAQSTFPIVRSPRPKDSTIAFELDPMDPPVVFIPTQTVAVRVKLTRGNLAEEATGLHRGQEGDIRYVGPEGRGLRYDAYLAPPEETFVSSLSSRDRERYLALSPLPTRVAELAHKWTDGLTTGAQRARAIEYHLRHDYAYAVDSPSGASQEPIDDFLFESRRGHCEFFSTAMAVMLREIDIPSRNVTGFVGGTYNRFGKFYVVRQGDAHSWVEAYIDDGPSPGWQTFDPTPASDAIQSEQLHASDYARDLIEAISQRWNRYIVGYDLRTQAQLLERVSDGRGRLRFGKGTWTWRRTIIASGIVVGVSLAAYAGYRLILLRRRRREEPKDAFSGAPPRATALYGELEATLARHGLERPIFVAPLRHAEVIQANGEALSQEIVSLTEVYLSARFGGARLSDEEVSEYGRRVAELDAALRKERLRAER